MIKDQFNINVFSNDPEFCKSLATECNNYGFLLTFIDNENGIISELDNKTIGVMILDLHENNINPFNVCSEIKNNHGLPVFGVLNKFSKQIQEKAKKSGFDLIFTKKMLIRSIREVIIHVSNE